MSSVQPQIFQVNSEGTQRVDNPITVRQGSPVHQGSK